MNENKQSKVELTRKWVTTIAVLLVIPMINIEIRNIKLEIEKAVSERYETMAENRKAHEILANGVKENQGRYEKMNEKIGLIDNKLSAVLAKVDTLMVETRSK